MNKEQDRCPVPIDPKDKFMTIVWSLIDVFNIEEVPDALDYIQLLSESIERFNFEKKYKITPQKKVHQDRKRFISIFKNRYLFSTDLEYSRAITPVESKLIHQTNKTLEDKNLDCDQYLEWIFNDFFVENPQFAPGTIKQVCSQAFLHKFIFLNKEKSEENRREELKEKEKTLLLNKARKLIRDSEKNEVVEGVKSILREFKDGTLNILEFKKKLNELEGN